MTLSCGVIDWNAQVGRGTFQLPPTSSQTHVFYPVPVCCGCFPEWIVPCYVFPLYPALPVLDFVFPNRMLCCCCCCLFLNKSLSKVSDEQSKVWCFLFLTTEDMAHLFCITDAIKFMLYIGSISYVQYSLSFGDGSGSAHSSAHEGHITGIRVW